MSPANLVENPVFQPITWLNERDQSNCNRVTKQKKTQTTAANANEIKPNKRWGSVLNSRLLQSGEEILAEYHMRQICNV